MPDQTASGYDALAAEYANHLFHELDRKPFDREFLNRFAGSQPAGPILDIGCGPGHVSRYVQGLGRAVSGVDISTRMIACARELNPGIPFHVGDMRSLPCPPASFAGLIAFYSIIHLQAEELTAVFAEMRRLLVPGGVLALSFHIGDEVRHIEELWGVKTCLDFVFFEPDTVAAALGSAGFHIVEKTCREPYDATVEAQTHRCYVLAD
jgi:SAM-dependent methyltransferase